MAALVGSPASATVRLLLVEDQPPDAQVLRAMLSANPSPRFELSEVRTIRDACREISRTDVDIIILDLGLPDASELSGLLRLQECGAKVPIVVLTGSNDEQLALGALAHGAEDFLVKGYVDRATLIRAVRYALERHRSVHALHHLTQELQRANATLEQLAFLDPLTDLLNRRGLQQVLSREVHRLERDGTQTIGVLVDVDDLKAINDSLGHAVGDVALKEVAARLRRSVRAVDYLARLGGDEFMILLPDVSPSEASQIAERIRLSIATATIQHSTGVLSLTATLAVMIVTPETPSIDEVLARMHPLLRRAKQDGKNRLALEQGQFEDTDRRMRLQADMCTNLSKGRNIVTVKQAIVRVADGSCAGFEFLSRYSNGTYETPDTFFRACAQKNILTLVDHHCLRRAIAAAASIPERVRAHVNLFPSTILNIPAEHLVESFAMAGRTFCIEISEQQLIGDPSHLAPAVKALRDAGVLIAIDDVGFGNSCLESLVELEPDVIKIDKRCGIALSTKSGSIRTLERLLRVSRVFGAEVIVEGIETEADRAVVADLGVEFAQGFLWGRPG